MEPQSRKQQPQLVVCCSNLPSNVTTEEVNALFAPVAPPLQIVMRPRANGSMTAYVHFSTLSDCERVSSEFNYHELQGRQINVVVQEVLQKAPPEGNIVVKNLPDTLNSSDLEKVFKMFGPIVRCMVASDSDGHLLGYGYVQFRTAESAKRAVECCKAVKLGDKILEVRAFDPQLRKAPISNDQFTNCFIKNFPSSMTRDELTKLLEAYGKITSLHFPTREDGQPVGFACANFEQPSQAVAAIDGLHNKPLFSASEMGRDEGLVIPPFYIQRAEEKENRTESLKKQIETLSLGGVSAKCNLYVSNIPDSFTKEEVKNIFMQFGNIVDFRISQTGSGKLYGYVCYATAEEACVAYEKVDGSYLDGSKLQISYYKTKQERKEEKGRREGRERKTVVRENTIQQRGTSDETKVSDIN